MITSQEILGVLDAEKKKLEEKFTDEQSRKIIGKVVDNYCQYYASRSFNNLQDLLSFCPIATKMVDAVETKNALRAALHRSRTNIFVAISKNHRGELRNTDIDPTGDMRADLPKEARATPERTREALNAFLDDYTKLAAEIGIEQVADILLSVGSIEAEERRDAVSFLTSYLGQSASITPDNDCYYLTYAPEILENQTLRDIVRKVLMRRIYTSLMEEGIDTMKGHRDVLPKAAVKAEKVLHALAQQAGVSADTHQGLFQEIIGDIARAAEYKVPATMVSTITHNGEEYPVPSLRQRIMLMELEHQKHLYNASEPGKGKTLVPILAHERQCAKRREAGRETGKLLFIAPLHVVQELPNRIRAGTVPNGPVTDVYYTSDPPTVGIIQGGMTEEEVGMAMSCDIVFFSLSMLHRKGKDGELIYKKLQQADTYGRMFSTLYVDEAHMFNGDKTWTRIVRELIHETPQLYNEGNVILGSGTPATNHFKDVMIALGLLEPQVPAADARTKTTKKMDPLAVRRRLTRLINYDEPEAWREKVGLEPVQLTEKELGLIQLIAQDSTITASAKIQQIMLALRCPELVSGDRTMESSHVTMVEMLLEQALDPKHDGKQTVLLAEHMRAEGLLRTPHQSDDDPSEEDMFFYRRMEKYCKYLAEKQQCEIRFHIIHGQTTQADRQKAFRDLAESKTTRTFKCVVLAHSGCLNVGIDLRSVERMISLQWPFSSPELQQLLKRSLRAGNTATNMVVLCSAGTVEEGIYRLAEAKSRDIEFCFHGTAITAQTIDGLQENPDESIERAMLSDRNLMRLMGSPDGYATRIRQGLHGAGGKTCKEFWESHLDDFVTIIYATASAVGNEQRLLAALIQKLTQQGIVDAHGTILHTNSFARSLEASLQQSSAAETRPVISMDASMRMLDVASLARNLRNNNASRSIEGTPAHLLALHSDKIIPEASCSTVVLHGLEQMFLRIPDDGSFEYGQRLESIAGAIKACPIGGTIIIPFPRDACTKKEFEAFQGQLRHFGLEVQPQWSGEAQSTDNEGSGPFREWVIVAKRAREYTFSAMKTGVKLRDFKLTHHAKLEQQDRGERTRLKHEAEDSARLPYRRTNQSFKLGKKTFETPEGSTEKEKQLLHLQKLEAAVRVLHTIAPTAEVFMQLYYQETSQEDGVASRRTKTKRVLKRKNANVMKVLTEAGITFLAALSKQQRPSFKLDGYNYPFYPYDKAWTDWMASAAT